MAPRRRPQQEQAPLATPLDEYLLPQYQQRVGQQPAPAQPPPDTAAPATDPWYSQEQEWTHATPTPRQQPGPDTTDGVGQAPATAPMPAAPQPAQRTTADPNVQPDTAVDEDGDLSRWIAQQAAAGAQDNAQAVAAQRGALPAPQAPVKLQPDQELADAQQRDAISGLIGSLGRSVNTMIGNHAADAAFADLAKPGTSARDLLARRATAQQTQAQAQAQQDLTEQTDPNSATNRRYQAVLADRFPDIDPAVLRSITVKDVQTNGLLNSMAAARDQANTLATRLQAQSAMQEDKQAGQLQLAEYTQGQQNARAAAGNAASIERARIARRPRAGGGGGGGAGANAQLEALRTSTHQLYGGLEHTPAEVETLLQGMTIRDVLNPGKSALFARLKALTSDRDPRFVAQQIERLSNRLEDSNSITSIENATNLADRIQNSRDGDFGVATNSPNWYRAVMQSPAAANLRADLQQFQNMVLYDSSGKAVTDAEFQRIQRALNTGALTTKQAVLHGIRRMIEIQRSKLATIEGGYGEHVVRQVTQGRQRAEQPLFTPARADGKIKVFDHHTNREYWIAPAQWEEARREVDAQGNPVVERR